MVACVETWCEFASSIATINAKGKTTRQVLMGSLDQPGGLQRVGVLTTVSGV